MSYNYNLTKWAETWQLQIASEKCFAHGVTNRNVHIEQTADSKSPYTLDDNSLNWSKETRDLGVRFKAKV